MHRKKIKFMNSESCIIIAIRGDKKTRDEERRKRHHSKGCMAWTSRKSN